MKANRIPKIDSTKVNPTDTRAFGGPQVCGIDFDERYDALQLYPDSPSVGSAARKIAFGGQVAKGQAASLATTVDWSQGQSQSFVTADGTNVLTFSNGAAGQEYSLAVKQGATGSDLITWPAAVKWPAGSAPTLTTTAGRTDVFRFRFDGTDYIGSTVGLNYTLS